MPRDEARAQVWYQLVLGIAMFTTLYESLNATLVVAHLAGFSTEVRVDASWQNQITFWWQALDLVWVAPFVCLVLGRLVAARVLVLVAVAHRVWPYVADRGAHDQPQLVGRVSPGT